MAQAGAQREPSMEEILASIRKIIENNDSDRDQPAPVARAVDVQHEAPDVRKSRSDDGDQMVDEDDRPQQVAAPAPAAARQEPAGDAFSLADIAAKMRTDKQPPVGTVLDESAVRELQELLEDEKFETDEPRSPQDTEDGLEEVARAIVGMTPGLQIREKAPEAVEETSEDPASQETQSEPATAGNGLAGLGQLMSVEAGEKVAQSFAQLDAAITAGSQRSFDEIAEELLRPMLQTWLDDNLPTLVERLVREEIERVSRGTRR